MVEYVIPEPTENPKAALVIFYKVTKGVEFDDRGWDRIHFPRCLKAASELLNTCGTFEIAKRCLEQIAGQFEEKDLSWTMETIVKHAHDWMQRRGKQNDKQIRQRFFDALAQQRATAADPKKGTAVTGGEILAPLRDFTVFRPDDGNQEFGRSEQDGEPGTGLRQNPLEAKEA